MIKGQISASNIINLLYFFLVASLALALVLIVLVVLSYRQVLFEKIAQTRPVVPKAIAVSGLFKDCKVLAPSCNSDSSCQYSSLCNFAENYANCRVYDCGEKYGVEINTNDGKLLTKSYDNPQMDAVKKASTACKGTVKVVSDKCEKSTTRKITAKVTTSGDCKVEAFSYEQNSGLMPATIVSSASGSYALTIPSCDSPVTINAIGTGGRLIGSANLNK